MIYLLEVGDILGIEKTIHICVLSAVVFPIPLPGFDVLFQSVVYEDDAPLTSVKIGFISPFIIRF